MSQQEELVLNWGIVSAGLISQDFAAALLSLQSSHHKLVGVAARNLDDAANFAQRFQVTNHYASYDELFANKEINIVYIGSVNTTHRELSIKALRAGKHVICEKPMAISSKEQEEVFAVAKETGLYFMEGLWTRFFPIVDKLKQELASKEIGDLNFYNGNFMVPIKDIERIKRKELGGGGILDIGIYPIQMACNLFNHEKPIKITATGHLMSTGVDECCTIVLLFPGQRIATINISTNCAMYGATILNGSKGSIQIPEYSWCPIEYTVTVNDSNGKWYEKKNVIRHVKIELPDIKTNFDRSVGLSFEAEATRKAIAQGLRENPLATHDNSRLIMHIMEEAKRQLGYVTD